MKKIDSRKTLNLHHDVIKGKFFLKNVYLDFYSRLNVKKQKGEVVELGSGAGFIKKIYPKVITSDVIPGPGIDKVFSAQKMPFKNGSLGSLIMIDTLHHIKDCEAAFKEMERVLKIGGKIVMVEPYNSLFGRFIYQNFHHENFDPDASWKIKGKGRLSDANGALPWVVFVRDRIMFERKFPNLKIVKVEPHTPFRYLISGGLSKPQLLPSSTYKFIEGLERLLYPLRDYLAMFVTIELEKRK